MVAPRTQHPEHGSPSALRSPAGSRAGGFTLIELLAVAIIMGILAAVVVASLHVFVGKSQIVTADANLGRVSLAELSFANDFGSYTPDPTDLQGIGNDLTVVPGTHASNGPTVISLAVSTKGTLILVAKSQQGACRVTTRKPLSAGGTTSTSSLPSTVSCSADGALPSGQTALAPTSLR